MERTHKYYIPLVAMSKSINPETGKYFTLKEMGDKFGFSKERARQILGNKGYRNSVFSLANLPKKCPVCSVVFRRESKYCSTDCKHKGNDNILGIGVPRKLMTPEQSRAYQKLYYRKNWAKKQASNEKWRLKVKDTPEYIEKKKIYYQEYYKRNRKRIYAYQRKLYWENPEKFRAKANYYYHKKKNGSSV